MPPVERTHYWCEDPDGWTVEVVSQGDAASVYRAYVGRDGRRRHKTPWVVTESEAWLDGRAQVALERVRAQARRVEWWQRAHGDVARAGAIYFLRLFLVAVAIALMSIVAIGCDVGDEPGAGVVLWIAGIVGLGAILIAGSRAR